MKRVTINIGFVTNSSSCIHFFDKRVLEDPEVKTFLESYGIGGGYIGEELWSRNTCGSFLVTEEQKHEAFARLREPGYGSFADPRESDVVVSYGDEHPEISMELSTVLERACERLGITQTGSFDYN